MSTLLPAVATTLTWVFLCAALSLASSTHDDGGRTTFRRSQVAVEERNRPACDFSVPGLNDDCRRELAFYFAPVIFQELGPRPCRDFITRFDFDGDLDPTNQRQHIKDFPLPGHVYFLVVEGELYRHIGYALYHPDDYKAAAGHENDMEGLMLTVSYPHSSTGDRGEVQVMETLAHDDLYQYYNSNRIDEGQEDRDGAISFDEWIRPVVVVEAKGHGVKGLGSLSTNTQFVKYRPSATESIDMPIVAPGAPVVLAEYTLEALEESVLWKNRHDRNIYKTPFANWNGSRRETDIHRKLLGEFHGEGLLSVARPPWAWDDRNDSPQRGDWYLAPAYTVGSHLKVPGLNASALANPQYYVHHPLLTDGSANPSIPSGPQQRVAGATLDIVRPTSDRVESVRYFDGEDFREWCSGNPTCGDGVAIADGEIGTSLRVTVSGDGSNFYSATVQSPELWLPIGEQNTIRLKYRNPLGVPAARVVLETGNLEGDRSGRHESTILLPSLTVSQLEGRAFVEVDVTENTVYDVYETDELVDGDLYIVRAMVTFTDDLGQWGAEEVIEHLPESLLRQIGRFRDRETFEGAVDVFEIGIRATGYPRNRP